MKVCLITYDTPHLKTADVFLALQNRDEFELSFLFAPFSARTPRETLINHRPHQFEGVSASSLAQRFGIRCYDYEERDQALESDYLIVCGANILEAKFAQSGKIINGHAGLIPLVRGLDSFKWSIHAMRPIGNTLHIINEEADSGVVLHQIQTPVFLEDTIQTFADRHYKNEIWMLQNFDRFLNGGTVYDLEVGNPTKRMRIEVEQETIERFDAYKEAFAGFSLD